MEKSLSQYVLELAHFDQIAPDNPWRDLLREEVEARYSPQDGEKQLHFLAYLMKSWPKESKAYLKAHDIRGEALSNATEAQAAFFVYRTAANISESIWQNVKRMLDLAGAADS